MGSCPMSSRSETWSVSRPVEPARAADPSSTASGASGSKAGFDPDLDGDTLREECGVFGIYGHPDAAAITALGLHALQHRGQEAAGIVSFDGTRFHSERRLGLVADAFSRRDVIDRLPGMSAIGHRSAERRVGDEWRARG